MSPLATLATTATITTMGGTSAEIEARLNAGEWLLPGEVATLLDVDRSTVVRMLNADPPLIRYRHRAGRGRYRECDPESVRAALADKREVHG